MIISISQLEKYIIVIAVKHCFDATYIRSLYDCEKRKKKESEKEFI